MPSHRGFDYGVAIDAGSSGTRIYVYRWPRPEGGEHTRASPSLAKVEKEAVFSDERTPGIDEGRGVAGLRELIASAKRALPRRVDPSDVPIYLGATAGMRILDPAFEADILTRVRSLLRASGFRFRDEWARTIPGEEEGAYDWLVANYLKNDGELPTPATTYGALDLGGASTQISFPAKPTARDDGYPLRVDDVQFPLYTKSILYYGVDQARIHYDADFASPEKRNPCYPSGYIELNSKVTGSSDWGKCLETVAQLFDQPQCTGTRCLLDGRHRPPIDGEQKFIAMSAFVYAWDYLGLEIGADTDDLRTMNQRAKRVCNLSYGRQMARYRRHMAHNPAKRTTAKPHAQCFNAAFSYHLLSRAYGMPVVDTPIEIYDEIGGTKVQWALGLMLVEANKRGGGGGSGFASETSGRRLDVRGGVGVGATYNFVFVVSVAILMVLSWIPYRLKRPHAARESCLPLVDTESGKECLTPRKGR
ncbi:hypothetical protein ACHAWF_005699 [Thalassiosira exigua]